MSGSNLKILLVEDNEDDVFIIQEMLDNDRGEQIQISWSSTYAEGIRQILNDPFDAALIDYSLGKNNGLDFIREATEKGTKTPMIMITGWGDYEVDLEAMRAGAVDFLSKNELKSTSLERAIRYAVERRRSEDKLERHLTELQVLVETAAAMRSATTPEQMYPVILDQLMKWMKVDGAVIATPDSTTGDVIFRLGIGDWAEMACESTPQDAGITAQVLSTGQPYLNNTIQHDPNLVQSILFRSLSSGACIPLNTHQQTIGVIWIGRLKQITEEEVRLVTAIADMAASALYRATLFEQTQLRLQRLSGLRAIDLAINSSLDLRLTLSVFLDQAIAQLGVHAADVLQFEDNLQNLVRIAERGFQPEELVGQARLFWETFARQGILERKPVILPDVRKHLDNQPLPFGSGFVKPTENPGGTFAAYFAALLIAKGKVKGVLELFHRDPLYPGSEWLDYLQTLASQGAIAIDNAELFEGLQRSNEQLALSYDETIKGWSRALDLRDRETQGHSDRVTLQTLHLARRMEIPEPELGHIRRGALLHDIGKMAIPDGILQKPGPLDEEEWSIMRQHPTYAYQLLFPIPYLKPALDIPYCHHERLDGSGYPRGLKGEEIPLAARIFAVVDVWDAMRSDRPYRAPISAAQTAEYLTSESGIKFDPQAIRIFLELMDPGLD